MHGIPSHAVKLAAGDVLSIDAGAIVGGWHGDAARTIIIGGAVPSRDSKAIALLAACERAMWQGIAAVHAGARLTDISHAIETSALASGPYGVVREYTGHFIGSAMHMDPPVPNFGKPGRGPVLAEGMAMAIEPMLVLGDRHTLLLEDDWTVVTADGSLAAHFEHTVAITADGPVVTTAEDGGIHGLAELRNLAEVPSLPEVGRLPEMRSLAEASVLESVAAGEDHEVVAEEPSGARRP